MIKGLKKTHPPIIWPFSAIVQQHELDESVLTIGLVAQAETRIHCHINCTAAAAPGRGTYVAICTGLGAGVCASALPAKGNTRTGAV